MAVKRKEIRDAVKSVVQAALPGVKIFTGRYIEERPTKYANIFFSDGEVSFTSFSGKKMCTSATLLVGYHECGPPNDDALESVSEAIEDVVDQNMDQIPVALVPIGFEYAENGDDFFGIYLRYRVKY